MYPFAQQRRLAKAGGGRDEGQFAAQAHVQLLDQAWARDHVWPGGGDIKFGHQEDTSFHSGECKQQTRFVSTAPLVLNASLSRSPVQASVRVQPRDGQECQE